MVTDKVEQASHLDHLNIAKYNDSLNNLRILDPKSTHFQRPEDRFANDFASADQQQRIKEREKKQKHLESRRVNRYNREVSRWEHEESIQKNMNDRIKEKLEKSPQRRYGVNSVGYNILNYQY